MRSAGDLQVRRTGVYAEPVLGLAAFVGTEMGDAAFVQRQPVGSAG